MKTICILISSLIIIVSGQTLSSQINLKKNINSKEQFKLIPEKEVQGKLQALTKKQLKKRFNTLIPKENAKFYLEGSTLIGKINDKYYTISISGRLTKNATLIGNFFQKVDTQQKAKDIVFFLVNSKVNIIISKVFFKEYINGIKRLNASLIIKHDKIIFYPFKAIRIDKKHFKVSLSVMQSFQVLTQVYIVNDKGRVFLKETNIYVKEPSIPYFTNLSVSEEIGQLSDFKQKILTKVAKKISKERKRIFYQPIYFKQGFTGTE
jgi:hypothetical protein